MFSFLRCTSLDFRTLFENPGQNPSFQVNPQVLVCFWTNNTRSPNPHSATKGPSTDGDSLPLALGVFAAELEL